MSEPRLVVGGPMAGKVIASERASLQAVEPDGLVRAWEAVEPLRPITTRTTTYDAKTVHVGGRFFRVWAEPVSVDNALLALIDADPADVRAVESKR